MQVDRITEAIKPQVALVKAEKQQLDTNNDGATSGIQTEINEIRNMIEKLSTEFKRGRSQSNGKPKYRNRSRSKSRNKTVSTNNSNNNNVLCYYHSRFGDQARRCQKPCIHYKETKALEN